MSDRLFFALWPDPGLRQALRTRVEDAQLIANGGAPGITRDVYTLQYLHAASGVVG